MIRESELRRLPKAELHLHLDGSMRLETALELAAEAGIALRPVEARRRLVAPARCRNQAELLTYFDLPIALLQTAPALERTAAELVEALAQDGVTYAEIRWAPRLHLDGGLPVEDVIRAVAAGVAAGSATTSAAGLPAPEIALIVTAMRSHDPERNLDLARAAAEFGPPVVGFDLAGPESEYAALPHRAALDHAAASGLGVTAHAGEVPGSTRVGELLDVGVRRIAHGVTAADDPQLVAEIVRRGVTLDLCPTSNVQAGIVRSLAEHPVRLLHRSGVSVTISTDDRTVSDTTLSGELAAVAAATATTPSELTEIALNAFDRGFAPALIRRPLAEAARREWLAWQASRDPATRRPSG